jgi:hypothetical protein
MTIIIGITTPDGVILASESRTTQTSGSRRVVSDSAQKVFAVGDFGVATAGDAFISGNTIAGLMDQFRAQLGDDDAEDVDRFADALGRFFDRRFLAAWNEEMDAVRAFRDEGGDVGDEEIPTEWDPAVMGYALTFLVAGYDGAGIGHIHEVNVPGPDRGAYSPTTEARGSMWRGQTDVISRMLKGVDSRARFGLPDGLSDETVEAIRAHFDQLEYIPILPITVQDAIDYASFLIRTTIDMQRFSDGTLGDPGLVPGCGGPLQILVVEPSRTRWATKPALHVG